MTRRWRWLVLVAAFVGGAGAADEAGKANTDQDFVTKAAQGGIAEVETGTLASKQASDSSVKKFAATMVTDHTKANKELAKLAGQKQYTVPKETDAEHQKELKKLKKLTGAEFDKAYMDGQVKGHKDTVALFEEQAEGGKDADLKEWASRKLPELRKHLKMAQTIQGTLKGAASGTTTKPRDR